MRLTPERFREIIGELGLSQVDVARIFGADPRTARHWAAGSLDIPVAVSIALDMAQRHGIDLRPYIPEERRAKPPPAPRRAEKT